MTRSPINHCKVCGAPIARMRKIHVWDGYYLDWSRATYCSNRCEARASYRRRKARRLAALTDKHI